MWTEFSLKQQLSQRTVFPETENGAYVITGLRLGLNTKVKKQYTVINMQSHLQRVSVFVFFHPGITLCIT